MITNWVSSKHGQTNRCAASGYDTTHVNYVLERLVQLSNPFSIFSFGLLLKETAVTLNRVFLGQNRRGSLHTNHLLHQMPVMAHWCFCRDVWWNVSLLRSPLSVFICTEISHFVSSWTSQVFWMSVIHWWEVSQRAACVHSPGRICQNTACKN